MAKLLDTRVHQSVQSVIKSVVDSRKDFELWQADGVSLVRDDFHDRLMFRLRPNYPDILGYVDALDLMYGQQQAAQAIVNSVCETMARGRGQVFRDLMGNLAPVDWIGDTDPDAQLVRIEAMMERLAMAAAEIRAKALADAGL
jgi:hypothetical protein